MRGLMNTLQADRVMKAILDGVDEYASIAEIAGIDPVDLVEHSEVLDRAIQLMRGFYKYGHENMKPAGLPPPPNPYFDKDKGIEEQAADYFAFEAVQRNGMSRERCVWTCGQLGVAENDAEEAIDTITMPWRNGWKTYAQLSADGTYILMDKPPVKLHRHIDRFLEQLK